MMKKPLLLLSIVLTGLSLPSGAQFTTTVNDMYIPTSPGFVILDKAPASIEKPTDPKAFGITVLNAVKKSEGAVDITPFWLWDHPKLDFWKSINNKTPFLQTLNVSAAGSQSDTGSFLSLGIRGHLFRIYSERQLKAIDGKLRELESVLSLTAEELDEAQVRQVGKELSALRSQPTFSLELAAAMAGYSPGNRFATLGNYRYGAWLNARWQPGWKAPLSLVGVARYTRAPGGNEVSVSDSAFLDFGLGLSYANERFDIQFEYVKRRDVSNNMSYERSALISNYRVFDNLYLVGTLGKNFNNVEDILVLFGVKFGVSREKVKASAAQAANIADD